MKSLIPVHPGLGIAGKKLWREVIEEYGIDDPAGLSVLAQACEALDRVQACRRKLRREGLTFKDRHGKPKAHPLTAVERDARGQVLAAIKALGLDLEPVRDGPGRPSGR